MADSPRTKAGYGSPWYRARPWHRHDPADPRTIKDRWGDTVCEIPAGPEAAINAALILPAPEMLAALRETLPQLRWANIHGSRCDELIAEIEALVAKATTVPTE